jgi:hypothetical protein
MGVMTIQYNKRVLVIPNDDEYYIKDTSTIFRTVKNVIT